MEHFLERITPLRDWYINPNEKSNKSSPLSQGNVPLMHLLNAKTPFMS